MGIHHARYIFDSIGYMLTLFIYSFYQKVMTHLACTTRSLHNGQLSLDHVKNPMFWVERQNFRRYVKAARDAVNRGEGAIEGWAWRHGMVPRPCLAEKKKTKEKKKKFVLLRATPDTISLSHNSSLGGERQFIHKFSFCFRAYHINETLFDAEFKVTLLNLSLNLS